MLGLKRKRWSLVERRRRAAARTALYSSLVLTLIAGWAGNGVVERPTLTAHDLAWRRLDYPQLPEVQLLRQYVRIDTSPQGSEVPGAEFLAEQLRRAGIPYTLDRVDATHANLWAILEGELPEALVLHNHIDVTAPGEHPWAFPPFGANIEGPWLQGRGTFDMKSVAIAQLLAFLDVKASGRKPHHSLIFLATSAEESGSATGMQRILEQQPELARRFGVMITEGGGVEARSLDDIKYWGIEFAQRRYVHLVASADTRQPLEALDALPKSTPRRLCAETRAFLDAYAGSRDRGDFRSGFSNPAQLLDPKTSVPPIVEELLADGMFLEPIAARAGGGFERSVDILLLPDSDWDTVRTALLPPDHLAGIKLEGAPTHGRAPGSPLDHPVYRALADLLSEVSSRSPVGPYMLGHTLTDARFLRARGIPAYGFSPFLILSVDTYRVDRANEEIGLPGYVFGVKVYRELVRRLTIGDSPWQ